MFTSITAGVSVAVLALTAALVSVPSSVDEAPVSTSVKVASISGGGGIFQD